MSEAVAAPPPTPKRDYSRFNAFLRNDFLLRRIHSLTGVLPLTLFLFEHLFTNSRSTQGEESFNGAVKFMTGLPLFMVIEWAGIYIPLAIHLILGVWIARTARHNVDKYNYTGNWRYFFQRTTGIIIVVFLIVHLSHWRYGVRINYTAPGETESKAIVLRHYTPYNLDDKEFPQEYLAEYSRAYAKLYVARQQPNVDSQVLAKAKQIQMARWAEDDNMYHAMKEAFSQANMAWFITYLFGMAAACYHTGNGIWTFTITWGFIRSPKAQARFGDACLAIGAGLFLLGVFSLAGFRWGEQMGHVLHAIGFQHTQF